jgi:hypothetical protein
MKKESERKTSKNNIIYICESLASPVRDLMHVLLIRADTRWPLRRRDIKMLHALRVHATISWVNFYL